jgi:hypothetical protein
LRETFARGQHVVDVFARFGTLLVHVLESSCATGVGAAAFNCLLMDVETRTYDVRATPARFETGETMPDVEAPPLVSEWHAPRAAAELRAFRKLVGGEQADVLRNVLANLFEDVHGARVRG